MKTCANCGSEYPDDVVVCPADGQPLGEEMTERKKVTGVWRGAYGYGPHEKKPGFGPVTFTLKLKQGWFDRFEGTVADDELLGAPGTGTADGYFSWPKFEFTKQMPVGCFVREDGSRVTFREYLIAEGHPCEHELPAPPILYQGTFIDDERMQGVWTIDPTQALALARRVPLARIPGYWCAQFITDDLKADPSGGPTDPLFDKSLLSKGELEEVEGVAYVSLGKFNPTDFQLIIERIMRANIVFKTVRYEQDPDQEPMEEILVNPDDAEEAKTIINPDNHE